MFASKPPTCTGRTLDLSRKDSDIRYLRHLGNSDIAVFSTLTSEQIDLSRTRARGVADLKLFLEYARKGPRALAEAAEYRHDADFDSPFEEAVYDRLVEKGWDVHKQVGCSGYRIDLAVVDPDASGRYLLGVECDGANYHRAKTARDRDKLREGVLRDLGWQLHRVWSTDWWTNPEGELAKIEAALVTARDTPAETFVATVATPADNVNRFAGLPRPVAETGESMPPPAQDPQQGLATYKAVPIDDLLGSAEQFYWSESDQEIRSLILRVVRQEGPVSLKVVARRVSASWGMGRVGSRILDRVSALVPRNVVYRDRERRGDVLAISEFPKWRKYLISLSFLDKSSVRPVQVGGFEANIVVHRSTAVRGRGGPPPPWESSCRTRTGPVEADGTVDAQNAPTAPWKTLRVFHELPQGLSHRITHAKPRKAPKWRWETRIDPTCSSGPRRRTANNGPLSVFRVLTKRQAGTSKISRSLNSPTQAPTCYVCTTLYRSTTWFARRRGCSDSRGQGE